MKKIFGILLIVAVSVLAFGCKPKVVSFQDSPTYYRSVNVLGFGKAVVLHEKEFKEDFWASLTYQEWGNIALNAPDGTTLAKRAIDEAYLKASTFSEVAALRVIAKDEAVQSKVEMKMLEIADESSELLILCGFAKRGGQAYKGAIEKMKVLQHSFGDWLVCYRLSESQSELEDVTIEEMAKLASDEQEWMIVFRVARPGSETERIALSKLTSSILDTFDKGLKKQNKDL